MVTDFDEYAEPEYLVMSSVSHGLKTRTETCTWRGEYYAILGNLGDTLILCNEHGKIVTAPVQECAYEGLQNAPYVPVMR